MLNRDRDVETSKLDYSFGFRASRAFGVDLQRPWPLMLNRDRDVET